MKKQLMIAAVAATMASVSMADISIKGDAYLQYSSNKIGAAAGNADNTNVRKRVNLNVTGKVGATKVVISLRHDDSNSAGNAVDHNADGDTNDAGENDGTGAATGSTLKTHQFYLTTKVGPVNIKAGDFYGTIGLGAWSKGGSKKDALSLSTKVGAVKLGMFTSENGAGGSTNVSIAGKIGGAAVKLINNPSSKWTDLSVKGTFNGILVAAESFTKKATDTAAKQSVSVIHIGGKASGIKWDVAQYKNKDALASSNAKFAPLGSMLVGKSARGGTNTAAANAGDFSKITGVAASTKFAGNTVKAILTKSTLGETDTVSGTELILTRPVSGGKLTVNMAKLSGSDTSILNATNMGLRFDVKF